MERCRDAGAVRLHVCPNAIAPSAYAWSGNRRRAPVRRARAGRGLERDDPAKTAAVAAIETQPPTPRPRSRLSRMMCGRC